MCDACMYMCNVVYTNMCSSDDYDYEEKYLENPTYGETTSMTSSGPLVRASTYETINTEPLNYQAGGTEGSYDVLNRAQSRITHGKHCIDFLKPFTVRQYISFH